MALKTRRVNAHTKNKGGKMDFLDVEKTPKQRLQTRYYSIKRRLGGQLSTKERADAERALRRTAEALEDMGVRVGHP